MNFLNVSANVTRIEYDPELILTLRSGYYQPIQTQEEQTQEQVSDELNQTQEQEQVGGGRNQTGEERSLFSMSPDMYLVPMIVVVTVAVAVVTIYVKRRKH